LKYLRIIARVFSFWHANHVPDSYIVPIGHQYRSNDWAHEHRGMTLIRYLSLFSVELPDTTTLKPLLISFTLAYETYAAGTRNRNLDVRMKGAIYHSYSRRINDAVLVAVLSKDIFAISSQG